MLDSQVKLFELPTGAFLHEEEIMMQKQAREEWAEATEEQKQKKIKKLNERINEEAAKAVKYNDEHEIKRVRHVNEKYLNYKNKISIFESTLTRSFGIKKNEETLDIINVTKDKYINVFQDLITNGFDYNGKHYIYFTSSAGQIRKQKAIFVNEEKYLDVRPKLMCGLTEDEINKHGGININKFLAYKALVSSATDPWKEVFGFDFDIDRCIVVDDFETEIKCKVTFIDYETYEINPGVEKEIPIPHTDGCGMILPEISNKNFMIRLPWVKGLMTPVPFRRFIEENHCSPIIKDIWGKEWNIEEDNIKIIFTKSQVKLNKSYYESWEDYKKKFKEYDCEAGILNIEEDKIKNAQINYQMLQTLYDASDEEIKELCRIPNKKIRDITSSLENALGFFKVNLNEEKENKSYYQKALRIYPELINDPATRQDLRDFKNSRVKKYKAGKLDVQGKFTFILPDTYAWCEYLFLHIEQPLGLLKNNEVYCRLFPNAKELDCLRSPHLYIDHAIRDNMCGKKYRNHRLDEWYCTDGLYTSTYDPISKILMFDCDGDRALVLAQKNIIEMAKRVTKGVYPLYYEMKKAEAEEINPHNIFKGLYNAFEYNKVGRFSNNITRIWNSGEITEEGLKVIMWLCMEDNFSIDAAKTLFMPTRPKEVDRIIKSFISGKKVPYFFQYAKDKELKDVADITNSIVNRIGNNIIDKKHMFKPIGKLGKPDYRMMLKNIDDNYCNEEINTTFQEWNKKWGQKVKFDEDNTEHNNISAIAEEIRRKLAIIEPDTDKVVTSLVDYFYNKHDKRKKKLLWYVYGEELYNNLSKNAPTEPICHCCGARVSGNIIGGKCRSCRNEDSKVGQRTFKCVDCGTDCIVPSTNRRACRCTECQDKARKIQYITANNRRIG